MGVCTSVFAILELQHPQSRLVLPRLSWLLGGHGVALLPLFVVAE